MKVKVIFGTLLTLAGIGLYLASVHITNQVEEGKGQVASGQKKVDQANKLFSQEPATGFLGKKLITEPGQKKIDEGKAQIAYYETLAGQLKTAGIIVFFVGIGLFFIPSSKKK